MKKQSQDVDEKVQEIEELKQKIKLMSEDNQHFQLKIKQLSIDAVS